MLMIVLGFVALWGIVAAGVRLADRTHMRPVSSNPGRLVAKIEAPAPPPIQVVAPEEDDLMQAAMARAERGNSSAYYGRQFGCEDDGTWWYLCAGAVIRVQSRAQMVRALMRARAIEVCS